MLSVSPSRKTRDDRHRDVGKSRCAYRPSGACQGQAGLSAARRAHDDADQRSDVFSGKRVGVAGGARYLFACGPFFAAFDPLIAVAGGFRC